jgi:hypothetical protein
MTIAICYACGATKFGALIECKACKETPKSEDAIIASLVATDRHFPLSELENISRSIRDSGPLDVEEETKACYRPVVRDAQRLLDLAPANERQPYLWTEFRDWFVKRNDG